MSPTLPASISSRCPAWLCWLLLFVAVVFGPSHADASRMDTLVRATAPNPTGPPPVSESTVFLTVPPNLESATYDFAGRMASDAYWVYGWDAQGRMTDMTRKDPTLVAPDVLSERLDFICDADGRRTLKRRTVTYPQNKIEIEESQVLWAKWLPVYEIRRKNGAVSSRRWFQWGVDLSGTLDGAGGIGGLVAIIEENAAGAHTRTLLPVQDGLGNVTAVIDALTGSTVARYDYGPFGEPLGVTGDADACPFRFQTKWYDKETEHYYFGYRYYSPRLGRWLSRDPLGEAGGINLYGYCGNDPVNRHDPLGLADSPIIITDPTVISRAVLRLIDGWFEDRQQIEMDAIVGRRIAHQNPEMARAASTGLVGRVRATQAMHSQFFDNKALENDGLLPGAIAEAILSEQQEGYEEVKAFSDAVLDVNLRAQENFEVPFTLAMAATPSPFAKGRVVTGTGSLWKNGVPGIQTRRFGNFWVKRVNPDSNRFMQWWGRQTIKSQEKGLAKLGDLATEHSMRNGVLLTRDVGATFKGGRFSLEMFNPTVRSAYLKGSWRMRNPFNDIIPRNIGINGKIFDPSIDWVTGSALVGGGGLMSWGSMELGYELFDEED